MAKRIYLTAAAALTLLAACNGPNAPRPAPPPAPDLQTAPADQPPPPPLLGGPHDAPVDNGPLLGGPYATADKPGPLTTFRRPDGVEVTVMRPIPNPEDGGPAPPHRHGPDRIGDLLAQADQQAAKPRDLAQPSEAPVVTQPAPPSKLVEQARRAAPPPGAHHKVHIKPPASPKAVVPPPTKPSLVDHLSDDKVQTPAGETSPKSLLGWLLLLVAMVLAAAIARRMARASETRERARRAPARAAIEPAPETAQTSGAQTPTAETPPEPKAEPDP